MANKDKEKGFFAEFKEFISKGNILDMAVGVIIGSAFGKIVSSFVGDIIMPAIGGISGSNDLSSLKWVLKEAITDETGAITTAETAIRYGQFMQVVLDFIIVAFCMFIAVKTVMGFKKRLEALKAKEEVKPEEAPKEPTTEEKTLKTLEEIKELLKESNNK